MFESEVLKPCLWDFPGSPVVGTSSSGVGNVGSSPGWGAVVLCASRPRSQGMGRSDVMANSVVALRMVHIERIFFFNKSLLKSKRKNV